MIAVEQARAAGGNPFELHKTIRLPEHAYLRGYEDRIEDNVRRILTYYGIGW